MLNRLIDWVRRWRSSRLTTKPSHTGATLLCRFGQGSYETRVYGEVTRD